MPRRNRYKPRPDGRYEAKVWDGTYKPDGQRNRIAIYGHTSKEVEDKVDELRAAIKSRTYIRPSKDTVADYAAKWLTTYKAARELNTRAMYKNIIDKHIVPEIGNMELKDLTHGDVQGMINDRSDKPRTCQQILITMRQIIKRAEQDRLLPHGSGICDDIEMPSTGPRKKKRPLTDLEKEAIPKAALSNSDRAYVYIIFGCGLRREEAIALHTSDIDLTKRKVIVRHKIVFDGNTPLLMHNTKTDNGLREVPIPKSVYGHIQFYTKMITGKDKKVDKPLFTMRDGGYISKSSYDKMWARILRQLNAAVATDDDPEPIQGLTGHIFRHNYATMLYYSGISEIKAVELMGHADGKMIREIYAHLQEERENTVDRLDAEIVL